MLNFPVPFPHVGANAFLDEVDAHGADVVETVRILSAPDPQGMVLISIRSRRYPGEVASGNRRVLLSQLREHERAAPSSPKGRTKGRRPNRAASEGVRR